MLTFSSSAWTYALCFFFFVRDQFDFGISELDECAESNANVDES